MFLIDTNILVYAVSAADKTKRDRARAVLSDLMLRSEAALALQSCAEFLAAAALKPGSPLSLQDALRQLRSWERHMILLFPSFETVELAAGGVSRHKLSFWDAMIWAVALQHEIPVILTEDGPVGSRLRGVRLIDPFQGEYRA